MKNLKKLNIKRRGQSMSDFESCDVALQGLHENLNMLENKAGKLNLPLVSHMIGVAGLLLVEQMAEEITG